MMIVVGPVLVFLIIATGRVVVRSRRDTDRIDSLETALAKLVEVPAAIKVIDERCMTRCRTDRDARGRNDEAHLRIENSIEANRKFSVDAAEKNRKEALVAIETLKKDLIREFYLANGKSHA